MPTLASTRRPLHPGSGRATKLLSSAKRVLPIRYVVFRWSRCGVSAVTGRGGSHSGPGDARGRSLSVAELSSVLPKLPSADAVLEYLRPIHRYAKTPLFETA